MDVNKYSEGAKSTAKYPIKIYAEFDGKRVQLPWLYPLLGLLGEAGELSEKMKKSLRDNEGEYDDTAVQKELGDVEWYVSELNRQLGFDRSETMQKNLDKLQARAEKNMISGDGDDREEKPVPDGYSV